MSVAIIMEPNQGTLTLGASGEQICQVVVGMITCEQPENVVDYMCGTTITYGTERFYLDIDFFQDWHANGLSKFLYDNHGTTVAYAFSPMLDLTPKMAGNVRLRRPATFGGPPRQPARDRVRLACVDTPALTADA